ncbi:malate dehydrogenase, glyoxysomal-like protein [Tanacetum coccineum]
MKRFLFLQVNQQVKSIKMVDDSNLIDGGSYVATNRKLGFCFNNIGVSIDAFKSGGVWGLDPRDVSVPVVGGHVGVTVLPHLSQVKPACSFTEEEIE